MASGYDGRDRVWVVDRRAGRAYPIHRALIALDPQRYEVDEDHPVLDRRGVLLEGKPITPKGEPPKGKKKGATAQKETQED